MEISRLLTFGICPDSSLGRTGRSLEVAQPGLALTCGRGSAEHLSTMEHQHTGPSFPDAYAAREGQSSTIKEKLEEEVSEERERNGPIPRPKRHGVQSSPCVCLQLPTASGCSKSRLSWITRMSVRLVCMWCVSTVFLLPVTSSVLSFSLMDSLARSLSLSCSSSLSFSFSPFAQGSRGTV
jgi:hypothetical protein